MMRAPASGFLRAVLLAQRHQAGHLLLGEADLLAAELGEREVLHLERFAAGRFRGGERVHLLGDGCHAALSPDLQAVTVTAITCLREPCFGASVRLRRTAPGPSPWRPAAARRSARRSNPASPSMRRDVLVAEAEPDVTHLLAVALAIVRQHVDDDRRGRPA